MNVQFSDIPKNLLSDNPAVSKIENYKTGRLLLPKIYGCFQKAHEKKILDKLVDFNDFCDFFLTDHENALENGVQNVKWNFGDYVEKVCKLFPLIRLNQKSLEELKSLSS